MITSSDAIRLSIDETKIKATAMGIRIGIGNRIKIGVGGSQSWESYLYGQSDLNLWVKTDTRDGVTLPDSLGGTSVTILPMTCKRSVIERYAETSITANSNAVWVVRGRFMTNVINSVQGAYVAASNTRFYFGSDGANKWRFGWGSASGLSSPAAAADTDWHVFIMYDKRLWIVSPSTVLSDASILNIIASTEPTINNSAATWSGTSGTINFGRFGTTQMPSLFEYALSYIGSITDNAITWERKYILYGTRIQDILNADTNITWDSTTSIFEAFSEYGSTHMMDYGYSLYRAYAAASLPLFIPHLYDGTPNPIASPPAGYYLADTIAGNATNYNLAPACLNIPYANFDKSDTTIWEDAVRAATYYDVLNPYRWREDELNRWALKNYAKTDYKNIVFTKNQTNVLNEIISYNTNISAANIDKVLSYVGTSYYNNTIGFDVEYESDDLLYKYSTKNYFYQNGDKAFAYDTYGFIFYSEDGGDTFPYINEFADSTNIQMCHIFANETILFATRTKIYYSTDKLKTVTEYTVKDTDGSDYLPHTPANAAYPGSYFSIAQNYYSYTIGGKEIFIWGNYSNSSLKNGASPSNIYYSIDGGCPKVAYKFGQNPIYYDDGTDDGGVSGATLGDVTNPLYCRHLHSVTYNSDLNEFYACTGDHTNECHWLKGTYNWGTDVWTWTTIIVNQSYASRWKTGSMIYNADDGYIYFVSDSTLEPFDYGLFKVLPADIGSDEDCTTISVLPQEAASFFINGTELIGRSAAAADFIFYSKDLINVSTIELTKPDATRDTVVGLACSKNTDGYYKFMVLATVNPFDYTTGKAILIKIK